MLNASATMNMTISPTAYEELFMVHLENGDVKVVLTNYGATISHLCLMDAKGKRVNVVAGYDEIGDYMTDPFYMGSTVGRVAGRISRSQFAIGDKMFFLKPGGNQSGNHLHGGEKGFNKKRFAIGSHIREKKKIGVEFLYKSADGEEGYPGNLDVRVTYTLTAENNLTINYKARTDKPTHVNLTNHCYFNLTGEKEKALEQELLINAQSVLQTDKNYIPTGETKSVKGTPYDFTTFRKISHNKGQLPMPGYNECYLLDKSVDTAAVLYDPESGRTMKVTTSYPSLIFYSGDYLNGDFQPCEGVCLEAQFLPDAPNHPAFGGTLLLPGEVYDQFVSYRFYPDLIREQPAAIAADSGKTLKS